jgi:hypothetical protein
MSTPPKAPILCYHSLAGKFRLGALLRQIYAKSSPA